MPEPRVEPIEPLNDSLETVELGEFTLIRMNDEWRLWCGCGDVIDLPDVIHGHCVNCHVTCDDG
jgi:hypothetical protein